MEAPQGTSPTTNSFPGLRVQTPTYSDLYCAGFISKQTLPDANFVAGGLQTPSTTKFVRGDMIYLQGSGYTRRSRIRSRSVRYATSMSTIRIPARRKRSRKPASLMRKSRA